MVTITVSYSSAVYTVGFLQHHARYYTPAFKAAYFDMLFPTSILRPVCCYTVPCCPLPAVGSAERSGPSGPLLQCSALYRTILKMLINRYASSSHIHSAYCQLLYIHIYTYMHVSGFDQVPTPQLFYTCFYNHAHRLRREKLLYIELSRSSNGFFKPLLDPDDGFTSETAEQRFQK
jgi:hypothetical protein